VRVDFHMHTMWSGDATTTPDELRDAVVASDLDVLCITDHGTVNGALALAEELPCRVVVGQEVRTWAGELIGLFLQERLPYGLPAHEAVAAIREQGGLVYVPHPFDRLHAVPDYEHLLDVLDDVDAIEVFNPRVAFKPFNEEAVRFAAKYRIVAGAGSDSHVAQGLGSVRIRMRDFDGPEEFLESLREADIVRRPTSLLYVQALKFLETTAIPPAARRARRERRVRRATRKA